MPSHVVPSLWQPDKCYDAPLSLPYRVAMHLNPTEIDARHCYQILVGAVIPRPIAWISTIDAHGVSNLAPYSFFTVASCNPPVLCVNQVNPANRREKDTLANLRATGECVVNIVPPGQVEAMNASCGDYPPGVSEFEAVGIASSRSHVVKAPGVLAAQVRFECRLRDTLIISPNPMGGSMMLLDVVSMFIDDSIAHGNQIDTALLAVVGKLGGNGYCTTEARFELERPVITATN